MPNKRSTSSNSTTLNHVPGDALAHIAMTHKNIRKRTVQFKVSLHSPPSINAVWQHNDTYTTSLAFLDPLLQLVPNAQKEFVSKNFLHAYVPGSNPDPNLTYIVMQARAKSVEVSQTTDENLWKAQGKNLFNAVHEKNLQKFESAIFGLARNVEAAMDSLMKSDGYLPDGTTPVLKKRFCAMKGVTYVRLERINNRIQPHYAFEKTYEMTRYTLARLLSQLSTSFRNALKPHSALFQKPKRKSPKRGAR